MTETKHNNNRPSQLRLLVYGTLKKGFWNHDRFCKGAVSIEEATIRGRLYQLPSGIPVLDVPVSDVIDVGTDDLAYDLMIQDRTEVNPVSSDSDTEWLKIRGELMIFDNAIARLRAMDDLEGFAAGSSSLYRRVLLPVYRQDGTAVPAWCYVLGQRNAHLRATDSTSWLAGL